MSAQLLGSKMLRRISRTVGDDVVRGWSHGGYWLGFVTAGHRHGNYHTSTGEWEWDDDPSSCCYSSCRAWREGQAS